MIFHLQFYSFINSKFRYLAIRSDNVGHRYESVIQLDHLETYSRYY